MGGCSVFCPVCFVLSRVYLSFLLLWCVLFCVLLCAFCVLRVCHVFFFHHATVVEASYDGPHLGDDGAVTMEFCAAMMKRFEDQKLIHKK